MKLLLCLITLFPVAAFAGSKPPPFSFQGRWVGRLVEDKNECLVNSEARLSFKADVILKGAKSTLITEASSAKFTGKVKAGKELEAHYQKSTNNDDGTACFYYEAYYLAKPKNNKVDVYLFLTTSCYYIDTNEDYSKCESSWKGTAKKKP